MATGWWPMPSDPVCRQTSMPPWSDGWVPGNLAGRSHLVAPSMKAPTRRRRLHRQPPLKSRPRQLSLKAGTPTSTPTTTCSQAWSLPYRSFSPAWPHASGIPETRYAWYTRLPRCLPWGACFCSCSPRASAYDRRTGSEASRVRPPRLGNLGYMKKTGLASELRAYGVAEGFGACVAALVTGEHAALGIHRGDGAFEAVSFFRHLDVAQHHGGAEHRRGWIDRVLAGDVRRRAVHRLEVGEVVAVATAGRHA